MQILEIYIKKTVSATVTSIRKPMIEGFKITVSPLEIQQEIVQVLDKFSAHTEELKATLQAEPTARRRLYEYYRDELLKPKYNTPMVSLKEIATDIYRGPGIKCDQVTDKDILCVRYGEIYTSYNLSFSECISHTEP